MRMKGDDNMKDPFIEILATALILLIWVVCIEYAQMILAMIA